MATEDLKITLLRLIKNVSRRGIPVSCFSIPDDTSHYVPCPFGSRNNSCTIGSTDDVYNESIKMFIELYGEEELFEYLL